MATLRILQLCCFLFASKTQQTGFGGNAFTLNPGRSHRVQMGIFLQQQQNEIVSADNITIIALTSDQPEISSCYAIRRSVFIEEQKVPEEIEMDSKDDTAIHILTYCNGLPCGAARLVIDVGEESGGGGVGCTTTAAALPMKKSVGKIGRVCVLASHRGNGIGRAIVLFAIKELRKSIRGRGGGGKAILGAQVHALSFYEGMGFQIVPGSVEYMDAGGVPHRDMEMVL